MIEETLKLSRNELVNALVKAYSTTYTNLYNEFIDILDLWIEKELSKDQYLRSLSVKVSNDAKNFILHAN